MCVLHVGPSTKEGCWIHLQKNMYSNLKNKKLAPGPFYVLLFQVWDNVAIVCLSDFGRTLNSNTRGTDHGWGGNYWVAGGKVNGTQMLGKFPHRLTEFQSDVNVGRGRFIPTTPWESVWNAVGEWLELDENELCDVLPHKMNFPQEDILSKDQLFEA